MRLPVRIDDYRLRRGLCLTNARPARHPEQHEQDETFTYESYGRISSFASSPLAESGLIQTVTLAGSTRKFVMIIPDCERSQATEM